MFGGIRFLHPLPAHHHHRAEVPVIAHVAAVGLMAPIVGALAGSVMGGFSFAMIGFGLGLAMCVVTVMITTALVSRD
jgi:hypothetical protein